MRKGSHFTPEQSKRLSESQIRSWYNTPGERERMSEITTKRFHNPGEREKTRQGILQAYERDPSISTRMGKIQKIRLSDPSVRKATSEGVKLAQLLDPSIMVNTWRGKALVHTHMSSLEERINNVIEDYKRPWVYNGCTGKLIIPLMGLSRKIPDFVHKTKPLVIEALGEYYHTLQDELAIFSHYRRFGYRALILWHKDVQNQSDEDLFLEIFAFEES